MIVNVGQAHITLGCSGDGGNCPIALALLEAGFKNPHVTDWVVIDFGDPLELVYKLPPQARQFITDFDSGLPVVPFSFELEALI